MSINLHTKAYTESCLADLETMVMSLYEDDAYGEPMTLDKIHRTINQLNHSPQKGRVELILHEQLVVGYALLLYVWSNEHGGDFLIIDEIFIKSNWRGKGLASEYFRLLEQTEKDHCVGLQLEVTPENNRARKLYQSLGFKLDSNQYLLKLWHHVD